MEIEYLSVTEYAQKVSRDVSSIRKMLLAGKLPGRKIGNQWIIPADAQLPDDKRIRSGKYIKAKSE